MDEYTLKTKLWLDERFRKCDEQGIYVAHQPIYGFRQGHCDPGHIYKYISTYQIMKALSHIRFHSLVDVGAAEGYMAYIANRIFGVKVRCCDLSEQACLRAREIFQLDADPADIQSLPYKDGEFDVALCTASLEHVADYRSAVNELLRVASKAVLVTVPHERAAVLEDNIEKGTPHGHIHSFDLDSFDFLRSQGHEVMGKKISSRVLMNLDYCIEPYPYEYTEPIPRLARFLEDVLFVRLWKRIYGKRVASAMVHLDRFMCNYYLVLFVVLKDRSCYHAGEMRKLSVSQIMDFTVPYHYLDGKGSKGGTRRS